MWQENPATLKKNKNESHGKDTNLEEAQWRANSRND